MRGRRAHAFTLLLLFACSLPASDRGTVRPQLIESVKPDLGPCGVVDRGYTLVEFTVTAEGSVRDVKLRRAVPTSCAESRIIEAVGKWRYRPGTVNGVPTALKENAYIQLD
jgi:TonB family protein